MTMLRLLAGISAAALCAGAAAAQNNTSTYNQTGANNSATVDNAVAGNVNNSSVIVQNGVSNSATVFQRNASNASFIQQLSTFNTATHQQTGTFNQADSRQSGDLQIVAVTQVGTLNSSTLLQSGRSNRSVVRQGYAFDPTVPNGELRSADFNTASVDQSGAGLNSVIDQRAASVAGVAASNNRAFVLQRSAGSSSSVQQTSMIVQESRSNYASVQQFDGAVGAANLSEITQRNTITVGANSLNSATVEQRGIGHSSQVTQDGVNNRTTTRMAGGGLNGDGNQSTISQQGTGLLSSYANVRIASGRGVRNTSSTIQSGSAHDVQVYQAGISDRSSVTQSNGVNTGTYVGGSVAHASAYISQNTTGSTASVMQTGDNYGEIVQALGGTLNTTLNQTDAGDVGGDRASNSAIVSQYGTSNSVVLDQNAIGATATVWQRTGSSDNGATVGQGSGGTALPSTSSIGGFSAGATGSAARSLSAEVVQGGAANRATVYQDGVGLIASVQQLGTATATLRSSVFISQTGSNNRAAAIQSAGVGPSAAGDPASGNSAAENAAAGGTAQADEFYFSGGARSAEIAILQTNANNSASVQQMGRGQFARIEQSGASNTASISQDVAATNATAVIRQAGSNNSYYVVQTVPGQYIIVTQTGSNNTATDVVKRGGNGGSNGITPPPGS